MISTYGLGDPIRRPSGAGPGLAGVGVDQQRTATSMLGQAAEEEARRNQANDQIKQADKQGKVMLGSTLGAAGTGIAGSMAAGSAAAAATAAGATAAEAASAGASAGVFGGPIGMAVGGLIGGLLVSKLF